MKTTTTTTTTTKTTTTTFENCATVNIHRSVSGLDLIIKHRYF